MTEHLQTDKHAADIIRQYIIDEKSLHEIALNYGVDRSVIQRILTNNNITLRKRTSKQKRLNRSFFETESDELYYFWGFVLGDGSLTKSGIAITLNNKDDGILKQFCEWLHLPEINIKYYYPKDGDKICRLNIFHTNPNFINYGIVLNKTYNPVTPNIPKQYIRQFLLGLIDADGFVAFIPNKSFDIELIGNPQIVDWYVATINSLGFNGHIAYNYSDKNTWKKAKIRRKDDVINLINILDITRYRDIILERKWSNALKFLKGELDITDSRKKLSQSQVDEIIWLLNNKQMLQKDIATKYDVNKTTIGRLKNKISRKIISQ